LAVPFESSGEGVHTAIATCGKQYWTAFLLDSISVLINRFERS
jgi:hypothetical protein